MCTLLYFVGGKVVIMTFLPDLLRTIVIVVFMFVFVSFKGTPFKTSLTPRMMMQNVQVFSYSLFDDACDSSTVCYVL